MSHSFFFVELFTTTHLEISSILERVNWEGRKLGGTISEGQHSFGVCYKKKFYKSFSKSKYGGREQALSAAREYQQMMGVQRGWGRNEYGFFLSDEGEQVGIVKLTRGKFMLFSTQHLSFVLAHTWSALYSKHCWYAHSRINGKFCAFHRLVLPHAKVVDHRNHDGLDNRIKNLRPADASLNALNGRISVNNTSGCRGVYLIKSGPRRYWVARIMLHGKDNKKRFSVQELGEEGAYAAACAYRAELEKKYDVSSV
jgi:hypothetical protein